MALAKFIDKAALAASHILSGFDPSAFTGVLKRNVVGVFFDDQASASPEGQVTLEFAVNMLARLYPSIALVTSGVSGAALGTRARLAALAQTINPSIEILERAEAVTVGLSVGATLAPTKSPTIYLGSDRWTASVSPDRPLSCGTSANPLGASAAACFGAANVFRSLFSEQLPRGEMDGEWSMSLLDYVPRFRTDGGEPANAEDQDLYIGDVHLVGVGAIGSSTVWALARMPNLRGTLHLVDGERYDLSNLQRYVLAVQGDIARAKVERAAAEFVGHAGLTAIPHQATWGEYLSERTDWHIDHVAAALDSWKDRCAVQASLPRRVSNAWTQPGDLGVSRHHWLPGDQACLMCLYLPEGKMKGRHELIAEALGLPGAAKEIAQLLYLGTPIGSEWIGRIAAANSLPVEKLLPFADEPIGAFYSKAVCGGMILSLGGEAHNMRRAEVPMAFQSALAGVMLAAEIALSAGGLPCAPLPTTTKIDVMRPLGRYLTLGEPKNRAGICICQDEYYLKRYTEKYA